MSVYFRVERVGSTPRIVRTRGLFNICGEDSKGVLTFNNPQTPFFSVYCIDSRYFICPGRKEIFLSGTKFVDPCLARPGEVIKIDDYSFHIVPTGATAEALAYSGDDCFEKAGDFDSSRLPVLSLQLAGLSKTFPLFEGFKFIVGSSDNCSGYLPLDGVAAQHISLNYNDNSVLISRLEGPLAVDGTVIDGGGIRATSTCKIKLLPSGIELELKFPDT